MDESAPGGAQPVAEGRRGIMHETLLRLLPARLRHRLGFGWRYLRGFVPWERDDAPAELKRLVRETPPGRALDLGSGTGTNALYLAAHGWEVEGVDFVARAVEEARREATSRGLDARFHRGDVTRLDELPLTGPFDLLLDIGCLHSLSPAARTRYATHLARLSRPGTRYLLYAARPEDRLQGFPGISPEEVAALFAPDFAIEAHERDGRRLSEHDLRDGRLPPIWPLDWYWLRRTDDGA